MTNTNVLNKYKYILDNEKFKKLKKYFAHGNTTVYEHCIRVALLSFFITKLLKLKVNKDELATTALLHDLYFYDWHNSPHKLHGFTHPKEASKNAKKIFKVNDKVCKNIESHMWPLNIRSIPKNKVAAVVCIADKIQALKETFHIK